MARRRPQREMWSGTSGVVRCKYNIADGRLTWCTDGTEENGVVLLEFLQTTVRDVFARLLVRL